MLAASWSKSVRKAKKVLLVNRIEHLHHGSLDDFIFQRSNPKRPFSPILFLDELTPRGQRPIGAAMNASMQIHKLGFQVLPILAPRGAIHSWSRISLELEIRRSQQIDRHVMK
jgi:hypothetical protein